MRYTLMMLALATTSVVACAPSAPMATPAQFQQADGNKDGALNRDEYEHLLAIRASEGDAAAARAVKANLQYNTYDTRFKASDSDGNGAISRTELGIR